MLNQPPSDLESWVGFFSNAELPVLRQTARRLAEARQNIDKVGGRDIANIVMQDPLMAIRVLAYIQTVSGKHLRSDITNIGNAVMMIGIEPFFNKMDASLSIEAMLKNEPQALLGVLQVIRRAQRASHYAHDWAFERHDMNIDEVALAALLHDLPEILLWCFAPKLAIEIRDRQHADKSLRSATAQEQVLGIRLSDLQLALCTVWHLPELLNTLLDDANAQSPRVQNVTLAVNLARHSAGGWKDAALPDDFAAIEKLLHIDRVALLNRLDIPEELMKTYLPPSEEETDARTRRQQVFGKHNAP
ncbi:putative signal transduction protein [Candidatus Propionivibrio aalborgensis]|uniref:Putative signal transduction protein n=2 Tax=Candidatus Propionivibrio aalborgensis TaxID=1860101 RepID=A0A1A8XZB2_9RHOO|nr:putative signal transduction protein [Candidatus Propionivibrio aalborgensis]